MSDPRAVYIGQDAETADAVFWDSNPTTGAPNPHLLVVGQSGFGKTYAISALLLELLRGGISSLIFDYGQGFAPEAAPAPFVEVARPNEILANRDGIAINPLQIFPSDLHGPVNVAQRIADTFARVYSKIGVQQHAILRQAVLGAFADAGILPTATDTWTGRLPSFGAVHRKLDSYAQDRAAAQSRVAASVASHVSTVFVFDTFRHEGVRLSWGDMVRPGAGIFIIQLKGLGDSLERVATEFLLWNLIGFVESSGPAPLRCFVVLDEAHRLSFAAGSPVEKLVREGRKFGIGLILASQQPEDFSAAAFSNTATKLVFQVSDDNHVVSRHLHRKIRNSHSFGDISDLITKLPRGCAYMTSENIGRVVQVASFEDRMKRWNSP